MRPPAVDANVLSAVPAAGAAIASAAARPPSQSDRSAVPRYLTPKATSRATAPATRSPTIPPGSPSSRPPSERLRAQRSRSAGRTALPDRRPARESRRRPSDRRRTRGAERRDGRDQQIVGHSCPHDQSPIPDGLGELGEGRQQPDQHHHLDERDRDEDVDQPIEGHRCVSGSRPPPALESIIDNRRRGIRVSLPPSMI